MRIALTIPVLAAAGFLAAPTPPAQVPAGGGRVGNIKVLSNHIDDVTTAENILHSFVKPGMSDAERSKALWTAAVRYRHQTAPPNEQLAADWDTHDPVKLFNVYGYCMCCCCSSIIEALNRLDGREARGRILNGHSVPEVSYGGAWHMYDCSLITLFPKPGDGQIAAVDDISAAVKEWYAQNPGYRGNHDKIVEFMRQEGWNGFKKGPALLANGPYYTAGFFPARTHGWDATMSEYDRTSEVYEYGYQIGHRALISLRPGESFVREASNRGLHVNMDSDPGWDGVKARAPENDLIYVKQFLPGYNGPLVGNGYHRYTPDLASGGLAMGAERYEGLAASAAAPLHPAAAGKPGVAVIEMSSPYVYLGGRIKLHGSRTGAADQIKLSLSTNNGRTFTPLWQSSTPGAFDETIKLGSRVLRRYAYWLKIELSGTAPRTAYLDRLEIENDIQHAPRTIPWLAKGDNKITISLDSPSPVLGRGGQGVRADSPSPVLGGGGQGVGASIATRTVNCRITDDPKFDKNETAASMGVQFDNLDVRDGGCWWKGGTGTMTVPVETPGDIVALRFGAQIRARGPRDLIRMLLSFDGGSTWTEAAKIAGPTPGFTQYFRYDNVPAGTRKALLRYEMTGNNTAGIFSFRLDADYRDPLAAKSFRPFVVTHRWKENGQEKLFRKEITTLPATYNIPAAADPEMISVEYAMPASIAAARR